ncbi:MAG: hypothetical protein A3E78_03210, partial [Alphaproteobacteria bacterium RIFCSPHIGHO2_12_FULL_63_12]
MKANLQKLSPLTVKLLQLEIDPLNVRKTGRGTEPKFAASIRKRGVYQRMIVRPKPDSDDRFLVVDGGERLEALTFLAKKGDAANGVKVTGDYPVDVEVGVMSDEEARNASLSSNLIRSTMHPVDEFEAFAAQIAAGATVEELAEENAMKVLEIRQALSLAAIAPEIRAAWRDGKIEGDAAEAYAQTQDLEHQVRVFKKLKGQAGEKLKVDEEIAGGRSHEIAKLLKLVGVAAYEKAGHQVNPSLFDDEDRDTIAVNNVPALKAMAAAKVAAECERLKKDGWGWAIPKDDVPKDLYAWRRLQGGTPSKAQKALAGCTVDVDYQGKLEVVRGYIKPGVSVKIEKTPAQKAAARKAGPAKPTTISAALAVRLSAALTKAAAKVVAENADPRMVKQIAVAALGCDSTFQSSCVRIQGDGMGTEELLGDKERDFADELKIICKLTDQDLSKRLARLVGASLNMQNASPDRLLVGDDEQVQDQDVAALVHFLPG